MTAVKFGLKNRFETESLRVEVPHKGNVCYAWDVTHRELSNMHERQVKRKACEKFILLVRRNNAVFANWFIGLIALLNLIASAKAKNYFRRFEIFAYINFFFGLPLSDRPY